MPAAFQSTIHLLESELIKARAALQELQPHVPLLRISDEVAIGAMAAYRQNLIGRAPDFYSARRLTLKELGLEPAVRELPAEEFLTATESRPQHVGELGPSPLEKLLVNSLILDHIAPYLSVPSLMALAATSRLMHTMIMKTPYIFRHLDLTHCRGAQPFPKEYCQNDLRIENEIHSAPLRRVFASLEKRSILQDVRTLVLDGLPVPADLVADIILTNRFNVNILSIRECRQLNERKLMQVIQYAVRPTRPAGTPRVKGIYHFSPMTRPPRPAMRRRYRDWWGSRVKCPRSLSQRLSRSAPDREHQASTVASSQQQNEWYRPSGKLFTHSLEDGWGQILHKCQGIIAFDAVLCRGPRHEGNQHAPPSEEISAPEAARRGPAVATVALGPRGCDGCHSSPEGPAIWGQSPDVQFPLLSPVPLHLSSVAAAKCPESIPGEHPILVARCTDCLKDRWCHRCNKWFCSNCLPNPRPARVNLSPHQTAVRPPAGQLNQIHQPLVREPLEEGVSRDCWECGPTCASCKIDCQYTCQSCQGDYCIDHNEGCSATMCDWCNTSARHRMRNF